MKLLVILFLINSKYINIQGSCNKFPVSTRRRFDVHTTSITLKRRRTDVKMTLCAYWVRLDHNLQREFTLNFKEMVLHQNMSSSMIILIIICGDLPPLANQYWTTMWWFTNVVKGRRVLCHHVASLVEFVNVATLWTE